MGHRTAFPLLLLLILLTGCGAARQVDLAVDDGGPRAGVFDGSLEPGDDMALELTDGEVLRGRIAALDAESLTLEIRGPRAGIGDSRRTLRQDEIARMWESGSERAGLFATGIALGVAAAAGAVAVILVAD